MTQAENPLGPLARHVEQTARLADRMLDAWEAEIGRDATDAEVGAIRLLAHRPLDDARNGGPDGD